MTTPAVPRIARPKRPPRVLVCAKCVRKADQGRPIRKALKAGLAEAAAVGRQGPGRLVDTKCLGVCPKRAVAVASGATLARGELVLVGSAADVPAALAILLG